MKAVKLLLEKLSYQIINGTLDGEISELVYDSRKVTKGCMFVCIKGAAYDSHEHTEEIAAKGARIIVAERKVETPQNVTLLLVEDTRYALSLLSAAYFDYPAEKMKVIGITGTKGKTTTTFMVKEILEHAGYKAGLIGTIETVIGDTHIPSDNTTPESYLIQEYFSKMVEAGCDVCVMEVSSQGLMMHRTAGIPFEIGIFTNLGEDHIGPNEHKDFEDYKRCKGLLFKQCRLGIANIDDPWYEDVFRGADCRVEFLRMLRPERRFSSLEALREQIARAAEAARAYLCETEITTNRRAEWA